MGLIGCRAGPPQEVSSAWPAAELREGGTVRGALAAGEVLSFELPLPADTFLRLVVEQLGADAEVALSSPREELLLKVDRPTENRGRELILAFAAVTGSYRLELRGLENGGTGSFVARVETLRQATEYDRSQVEAYRRFVAATAGPPSAETTAFMQEVRQTWYAAGEIELAGEAAYRLANRKREELGYESAAASYREAISWLGRVPGAAALEASCRVSLGTSLIDLNRSEEAVEELMTALAMTRREGLVLNQARALLGLSQAKQRLGELQEALDLGEAALALWPPDNQIQRPDTLHLLGVLHARRFHDLERGRLLLEEAAAAYSPEMSRHGPTLSQLGRLAFEQGQVAEARRHFEAALELRRGKKDVCPSVILLGRLALVAFREGLPGQAEQYLADARSLLQQASCPRSEPTFECLAGELAELRGEPAQASVAYRRAQSLYQALGDRSGLAESLAGKARAESALGHREEAIAAAREAIAILEVARPTVLREDLRTSFFSVGRQSFDLAINLLIAADRPKEAWILAEQARARSLRDLLEADPKGPPGDARLVDQEHRLIRQLNSLESQRLLVKDGQPEKMLGLGRQIAEVVAQLERLRGERRRGNPRYARLTLAPQPSLAEVRRQLDGETTVLEYFLGEPAGVLWVIRKNSMEVHRLPPRRALEELAGQSLSHLRSLDWTEAKPEPLCQLSRSLLPAGLGELGPRLVVVPDGALAAFPWSALVEGGARDCRTSPWLGESREISYLPSLETLLTERRQRRGRRPAGRIAAIFADPVYSPPWPSLPASATEAAAIAALLPAAEVRLATGVEVSRDRVLEAGLAGFRILHFATHGRFDPEQPLLSALVLSQRDAAGRESEGLLRAQEIFGLELAAELVVLSSCETGLGRDFPGEGWISGLPRAFLVAGAKRVMVSLWPVGDRDTRDLMIAFYRGLLGRKLTAARALQEAQNELRRAGRPPRAWSGFVLVGEFAPFDLQS